MSFETWAEGALVQIEHGVNLVRPSYSQSLYKYVGLNTETSWSRLEETLGQCVLTGATVSHLNDPFEASPCVFNDIDMSRYERSLRPPSLADAYGREPRTPVTEDEIESLRDKARTYLERRQRQARIVAFCERSDSPLLWSHYANSYKGACLHFLGSSFGSISPRSRIGYVKYSTIRPTYPLSLALALASSKGSSGHDYEARFAHSDQMLFFTKAQEWAYETEIRLIYDASRKDGGRFAGGGLLSIIIGPRTPQDVEERLRRTIAQSKLPHLHVRRARLSESSFSVQIFDEPTH